MACASSPEHGARAADPYCRDSWDTPSRTLGGMHYYYHRPENLQLVPSPLIGQTFEAGLTTPIDSLGIRLWPSALNPLPQRTFDPPSSAVDDHELPKSFPATKQSNDESCCSIGNRFTDQFTQPLPQGEALNSHVELGSFSAGEWPARIPQRLMLSATRVILSSTAYQYRWA